MGGNAQEHTLWPSSLPTADRLSKQRQWICSLTLRAEALLPWWSTRAKVRPCPKIPLQLAKEFSSTGAVSSKVSQLTTDIPNWHSHSQPVPREEGQSLEGLLWGSEGFQPHPALSSHIP